ncbi:MAG: NAD(P)/FAD-dependent oxidoreductase [Nitriliruptorales bacterium]|nr:NAD(P)/FAD-dependent oxidoreductase [Nitriliruptorales bacterium]
MGDATKVVIVGGGFGGLTAARKLASSHPDPPVAVTLVDRHNYHTFQPLLYQVATAGLQPQDIGHNLRKIFGRSRFRSQASPVDVRMGTVAGADLEQRRIELDDGTVLDYDVAVLAAGAVTSDYGIDGVAEHAFPLKSLSESLTIRNHLLACFERASAAPERIGDGLLTFVVAGGGPTGVELAGALTELFRVLRRDHPHLPHDQVRVVLVEMLDAVLPPYSEPSQRYTKTELEERGVEVRLGTAIERVEADRVVFEGGGELATNTLIWTAGVEAAPLAGVLGLAQGKGGRVEVDPTLRPEGFDDVFVIGDMALARDADGEPLPQLAPVAIQQGKHVARQLHALVDGRPLEPFRYRDKGTMATIGRNDAVVEFPAGVRIEGFLAWLSWLFLHLFYLVGFRNRIWVFLSWLWNYVTYDQAQRLILRAHTRDAQGQ